MQSIVILLNVQRRFVREGLLAIFHYKAIQRHLLFKHYCYKKLFMTFAHETGLSVKDINQILKNSDIASQDNLTFPLIEEHFIQLRTTEGSIDGNLSPETMREIGKPLKAAMDSLYRVIPVGYLEHSEI